MISKQEIDKLATLARIEMGEEEKNSLMGDLESILGYVSELANAPVMEGGMELGLGDHINIFREDEGTERSGLYTDKILDNAPRIENGYLLVKQIIGEKGERKQHD
ncbi:MAG: Asp-tRNA(Asn)/Glu-tRNA(Gln) amidotransferase subunit GatC [Candidatus Vogelbacteria bacterium]|nr:Asp-tRNA(Asn)/Glu-tRNA(Gln) amidotransferase subunit GatC [Candidatus Vogelbacteria bacterium]